MTERGGFFAKQMRFIIACLKNVCLENKFKTGEKILSERGRFLSGRGEDFIVSEDLPRRAKKRKIQICKKGG